MLRIIVIALTVWAGWARAEDPAPVDDAAYKTAMERLKNKPPASRPSVPLRPAPVVVYVIRMSGRMMPKFPGASMEVMRSIRDLPADAKFNLVLFGEGETASFQKAPVFATDTAKAAAYKYLQAVKCHGVGLAQDGVAAAMKHNPTSVLILEDGEVLEDAALLRAAFKKVDAKRVKVSVVLYTDKPDPDVVKVYAPIAADHGGSVVDIAGKVIGERLGSGAADVGAQKPAATPDGKPSIFSN